MVLGHDISVKNRTQDVRISEDVSFDTMLLNNTTLVGLKQAGFLRPSPIQLHGIPLGKCGFDLLLEAKSGTGKTAVFTVISLEKLDLLQNVQTIILAPTREIASQISSVILEIGSQYQGLKVAVVMGGLSVKEDIEKFKENVHIVVGSPGRLRHLIKDKCIDLSCVRLLVLDEADKLMEKVFLPDINYIFSQLPKQKQVIMSSATYSESTKEFIKKYVQQAQHVCPDSNSVLLGVAQKVVIIQNNSNIVKQTKNRYAELIKILNSKQFKQCLIFCNYQVRVGELHKMLSQDKWPAEQLYGQQDQNERLDALKTLQEYKCRILVSTDLAARGIDASNVDLVINFEPPFEWQTYLHRIGRAGRYGSYGTAISILGEGKEKAKFKETLALTKMNFNIHNLWNDEPFNLSDKDDTHEKDAKPVMHSPDNENKKEEDKSEDILWKALTTGQSEENNLNTEISSFKDLCASFKTSNKTNFETFSDLIQSFNQNDVSKHVEEIEFKHVQTVPLPGNVIKFWDDTISHKTHINGQSNANKNSTNNVNNTTNRDSPNIKKHYQYKRDLSKKIEENTSKKYSVKHLKMLSLKVKNEDTVLDSNNAESTLQEDFRVDSNENKLYTNNPNVIETKDYTQKQDLNGDVQAVPDVINLNAFVEKKLNNINGYNSNTNTDKQIDHTELTSIDASTNVSERCEQNNISKGYSYNSNHYHNIPVHDTTSDPIKQALKDAGLPTAFGKGRPTKNPRKFHSNQQNNCNERIIPDKLMREPLKYQHVGKKVTDLSSSKTFKRENYTQKYLSSSIDSDSTESGESSHNDGNTSSLRGGEITYSSSYNKSYQSQKQKTHMEQIREKQFDAWYKQLKHQTQYIQYALYLEELRKL